MEDTKKSVFRSLGHCEVCGQNDAKYVCPKCEVRSCCLSCVKLHKKELDCDGIRDRVKYKPINKFGTLELQNDYILLEEMSRNVDALHKDPTKRYSRRNVSLPIQLYKLQKAALLREVTLQFLPQHFSRHQTNTTYLNWKTNELFWKIDWIFPLANDYKLTDTKILDTTKLATALDKVLESQSKSSKLQFYQSADTSEIIALLKGERVAGGKRFFELDLSITLQENFQGKVIIEYPVIVVVLRDHKYMFDIIDPDEEENIIKENNKRRENKQSLENKESNEQNKDGKNDDIVKNNNFLFSTNNDIQMETDSVEEVEEVSSISYEFDY
uniref:Box C/D snoRNA protein 1 n=2 Tax=Clastoptera arizonana TaxID=38151 RepID=A0A1B6C7I4_9HEMI